MPPQCACAHAGSLHSPGAGSCSGPQTTSDLYPGHGAFLTPAISGQVNRIRSSILFADMRDYTRLTAALSPEEAVELLNGYFDCLVPSIEAEGGEVLKYMGDGLLAIFCERRED